MNNTGKLIILSAPSGSGKTTIIKHLLQQGLKLEFSISATSRAIRKGETHGVDYYYLTPEEFKKKIENNEFLEWEEVYKNTYYGTLKSEVERICNKGSNVIFDVDIAGGLNIKKQYGNKALALFIKPPSIEELRKRLTVRQTDTIENIEERLQKAEEELKHIHKFDKVIVNDDLQKALDEAYNVVNNFLKQ